MLKGYLVSVEKVKPGDKVRPKDTMHTLLGDLVPEREYTVVEVRPMAYWSPNGEDLIDFQIFTLEGQYGEFLSEQFDLPTTVISREALSMLSLRVERQGAVV